MSKQLSEEDKETRTESELHKKGAEMVSSVFVMPGLETDPQKGTSFYNNLERHTRVKEENKLYGVLLGTMGDLTNAYRTVIQEFTEVNGARTLTGMHRQLNNRIDLCEIIERGWMIHLYQSNISDEGKGRTEAVDVLKAIALERQATLEALGNKGSRLAGLKQALIGKK